MKIRVKLLLVIWAVFVPIVIAMGVGSYSVAEQQITNDVLNQLESISSNQKERLEETIDRNFERVEELASRTQLRVSVDSYQNGDSDERTRIEQILKDTYESTEDFKAVFIINPEGKVEFSTDPVFQDVDFSDNPTYLRAVYAKHVSISLSDENEPVLYFSGAMRYENKFLGIVTIVTSIETITSITSDYTGLGKTGETMVSKRDDNGDGLFIVPLRFDPDAILSRTVSKEDIQSPITQSLLTHQEGFTDTIDYRGNSVLSSTKYIPETDWGIVVKIDKDEAFATINNIQTLSIIGILTFMGIASMASLLFTSSIESPIRRLRDASNEIANGNFDVKVSISGNDEIAELSHDVNLMTDSLKKQKETIQKNERLSAIGELAARMAHDLRNPLTVLQGTNELLKSKLDKNPDEKTKEWMGMIDTAITRMAHQIEDVMDFVRTKPPEMYEHQLLKIIVDSLPRILIPDTVKIILPENDLQIKCDRKRLEIVFANLISNSIDAINEEGTITIRAKKEGSEVIIEIEDSGPGIEEEIMDKIFEPLFTMKEKGTGLGLCSCKNIIKSHSGTITVKNNPTTFTIKLPISQD